MATHNLVSFNECLLNKKNLIVFFPLRFVFSYVSDNCSELRDVACWGPMSAGNQGLQFKLL
jgi:hypothetical protein